MGSFAREPSIPCGPAGPSQGLIHVFGCEHTKRHRYSGLTGNLADALSRFTGDEVEVGCFTANHTSKCH